MTDTCLREQVALLAGSYLTIVVTLINFCVGISIPNLFVHVVIMVSPLPVCLFMLWEGIPIVDFKL